MRPLQIPRFLMPGIVVLLVAAVCRADMIYLKDGFVIHGKTKQQSTLIRDAGGEVIPIPVGSVYVDDGPRLIFFPGAMVHDVDSAFIPIVDTVLSPRKIIIPEPISPPSLFEVQAAGAFDLKWNRRISYLTLNKAKVRTPVEIRQHLTVINSYYVRADSTDLFNHAAHYLTREFSADDIRRLLVEHKDFQDPIGLDVPTRFVRRFRMYEFYVRAGWYNEADAELDRILNDLPAKAKEIDQAREKLSKLQAARHYEAIQRAHRAGRHRWLAKELPQFSERYGTVKAFDQIRGMRTSLAATEAKLTQAKETLPALLKKITRPEQKNLFAEAVPVIVAELHPDTVSRLDTFLKQAETAERQEKATGRTSIVPGDLLSLAVTGWVLGSASAETKFDAAQAYWDARKMVETYLITNNEVGRMGGLRTYLERKDSVGVDEIAQIIAFLPPAKAEKDLPAGIAPFNTPGGVKYHVQLPDEYTHHRSYPLLIVLHNAGDTAQTTLNRWAEKAKDEGYILIAPEWEPQGNGNGGGYGYTDTEHAAVLDSLQDVRKRFSIDGNRVFLHGYGQAGNMTMDIGLSHPDLFAGILPMSSTADFFVRKYWTNAQYLPIYLVNGGMTGEEFKCTRFLFDQWIPLGFPAIHVVYKGRGVEWYSGEAPSMFDWMNRKKRTIPTTTLGSGGREFHTMRPSDNRFYWVTTSAIDPRHINTRVGWNTGIHAARVHARMDPVQNRIIVEQKGFKQLTLWISRDARLDLDKLVSVHVNSPVATATLKVQAMPSVLLEDYLERGDRQNLYISKIELK